MKKGIKTTAIILAAIVALLGGFILVISRESKDAPIEIEASNPFMSPLGKAQVFGHRSGGGVFPENTLMAFKNCVNSKDFVTDGFEFDLRLTKDNVIVVLHDATFDRTSNAVEYFGKSKVHVHDYTYEELHELNMAENYVDENGDTPYKGLRGDDIPNDLRIVTLGEVFNYLTSQGRYKYSIDVKEKGEKGKITADGFCGMIREYGLEEDVIAASFNGDINKYYDEKYPEIIRSAGIVEVVKFYFASLAGKKLDPGKINYQLLQIPADQYLINLGTTKFLNYAHKYGIAVQYWTINDGDKMKALADKGADAIITDYPGLAFSMVSG
ncbi:MAG: hypothetical protein FWF08_08325 [Oscillospiraceae bacterium]|nr:hypothetical protein [Oscillospiraceae bacterium]